MLWKYLVRVQHVGFSWPEPSFSSFASVPNCSGLTPLSQRLTGSPKPVNFNGRADHYAAQLVSFVVVRVHTDFLHQGNKGNEEFCRAPNKKSGLEIQAALKK